MEHNAFRDTASSRCRYYTRHCGLPALLDLPWRGRIVVRVSEQFGAIRMPTQLGVAVRTRLGRRGIELGPVVAHARWWTYFVVADIPGDDMALHARVKRFEVTVLPTGATIVLPSPTSQSSPARWWVEPPRGGGVRLSGLVVVGAVDAGSGVAVAHG